MPPTASPSPARRPRRRKKPEGIRHQLAQALAQVRDTFLLTDTELGRLLGVSRQAIGQWWSRGVPVAQMAEVDRLRELAEVIARDVQPARIPAVIRQPADDLGGLTLLQYVRQNGAVAALDYWVRLMAYLPA